MVWTAFFMAANYRLLNTRSFNFTKYPLLQAFITTFATLGTACLTVCGNPLANTEPRCSRLVWFEFRRVRFQTLVAKPQQSWNSCPSLPFDAQVFSLADPAPQSSFWTYMPKCGIFLSNLKLLFLCIFEVWAHYVSLARTQRFRFCFQKANIPPSHLTDLYKNKF